MATVYFYATDGDFANTNNWYSDEAHTSHTNVLPSTTDDIILLSNLTNLGINRTFKSLSANNISISLLPPSDTSRLITCTTSAVFYNTTVNVDLSANLGVYFYGSSSFNWYLNDSNQYAIIYYNSNLYGDAYFYDTSSTLYVNLNDNVYSFDSSVLINPIISKNAILKNNSVIKTVNSFNQIATINQNFSCFNNCSADCFIYGNAYFYDNTVLSNYSKIYQNAYFYNNSICSPNNAHSIALSALFYDSSNKNSDILMGYLYFDNLNSFKSSNNLFCNTISGAKFNFSNNQSLSLSGTQPFKFWYIDLNSKFVDTNNNSITSVYFYQNSWNHFNDTRSKIISSMYFYDTSYNWGYCINANYYNNSFNKNITLSANFYDTSYNIASCYNATFNNNSYNTFVIKNSSFYTNPDIASKQILNISLPKFWNLNRVENNIFDTTNKLVSAINFINSYNLGYITQKNVYFSGNSYNAGTLSPTTIAYFNDFSYNSSGGIYNTAVISSIKKGINGTSLIL
jgi:hypothetical protein